MARPPLLTFQLTNTLDGHLAYHSLTTKKAEAEVVIIGGQTLDPAEYPKMIGLFKVGVGVENIDFHTLERKGVVVSTPSAETRKIIYEETASYATTLVLRGLLSSVGDESTWTKWPRPTLRSRRVLVIGLGNIGSIVAEKLRAFVRVSTFDSQLQPYDTLVELAKECDAISLHIPGGYGNTGFLDWKFIEHLKAGCVVVNTARGDLITEDVISRAISERGIIFLCDVMPTEPYKGPLVNYFGKGLTVSPHVAGFTAEYLQSLSRDLNSFTASLVEDKL